MKNETLEIVFGGRFMTHFAIALFFIVLFFSLLFDWLFLFYVCTISVLNIVFFNIYKSAVTHISDQRECWILIALSVLFYAICDAAWYFYKFYLGLTYNEYEFVQIVFLMPTITIFSALLVYFVHKFNQDIGDQQMVIINDILSIFIALVIFSIVIFEDADLSMIYKDVTHFSGFFNVIFSLLIIFIVLSAIFTSNVIAIHKSIFYLIVASAMYACVRIYYSYNVFVSFGHDNKFLVLFFLVAFVLMMIGAFEFKDGNKKIKLERVNSIIKWFPVVCVVPFLFQNNVGLNVIILLFCVLIAHISLSYYIKNNMYAKKLLQQEQEKHHELDLEISKQTNELILANLKLKEIIEKDYLTGVSSRGYLMNRLKAMMRTLNGEQVIAVYYVNLRRFRLINTSYGQDVGDRILSIVAKRLSMMCSSSDVVARFSADEFIVVRMMEYKNAYESLEFAKFIIEELGKEIVINAYHFNLEVVIGVEMAGVGEFSDVKDIIKNADKAMSFAKQNPGLNPFIYNREIDEQERRKARLEILIHQAILEREFEIYYQPVYNIQSGKIATFEALLRWNNTEFGFLEASEFIEIIKIGEYINKIYLFVIESLANHIDQLKDARINIPRISINIAHRQTSSVEFILSLKKLIKNHNIDAQHIEIEMSEMVWMNETSVIDEIFKHLQELQMQVCIDDFGTGYSSLVYIKKYNIGRIKIARDLTRNVGKTEHDTQIVRAVAQLAKTMGIKSVAKGVESDEVLELIKDIGFDQAQGYVLGRPMSWAEFRKFLDENSHLI